MRAIANNQLFAHTYLAQLQADPINDGPAAEVARGLHDWLPYRDMTSLQALADSWVSPVLDFLGFYHTSIDSAPHTHLLYAQRSTPSPVGLCWVVPPGQGIADSAKGHFPLAQAVLALRERELRWGILTDGSRWRLLDADALQCYEHYLEVDLDELARSSDPTPLRIFYACFHRGAFAPNASGICGLDRLLEASTAATEAAEKHLKAQVSHNEGIMAQLCLGLVQADGRLRYSEEERDAIYRDATYLLYRLLFLLHAEARGLLPMDHPAYRAVSLTELVKTAHEYRLHGMPDSQATTLWDRFQRLCAAIYESDSDLGIPAYNGGLFEDDDKPYLRAGHVADMYLTEALFDLAYMPDSAAPDGYRPIDYRDLSVRHLGSLYEGMIEYKLQIVEETLWARRDSKGNLRFLRTGEDGAPRKTDEELKPGSVYFSQSPGERRATGTYYTPEYIVDYIVRQTVWRGLEERRAPLEAKLAGWLQEIAVTTNPEERRRMQQTADAELLRFVEEQVLTFRVCDPAMGSGHFLVNTAHQITAFIVETLHLTPWEDPAVDADPIGWRRQVVEHCLYGVDLSLMAVELAKLSLWLASVAVGKPLSFLDHHLLQGNSLIGVRVEDLASTLAGLGKQSRHERVSRTTGQLSMWDDPAFGQHMAVAAALLRQISTRVADTVGEVKGQEANYEQVRKELAPYRQIGDLLVGRHFGLGASEGQFRVLARDIAHGTTYSKEQQQLLVQSQSLSEQRYFFHWELEFPQVFFAPSGDVPFRPGFDAIVGNPPYVRQERISGDKRFLQEAFGEVYSGGADLYVYFMAQGVQLLAAGGRLGMITANKWLRADYAASLREYLPQQTYPLQLLDFGHSDVFPGTDTFPCIIILTSDSRAGVHSMMFVDVSDRIRRKAPLADHITLHGFPVPRANLQRKGWVLEPPGVSDLLARLQHDFPQLGERPGIDALRGIITGLNEAFYLDTTTRERLVTTDPASTLLIKRLLRGRTIRRWQPAWDGEWMIAVRSSANRAWPWSDLQDEHAAEESFSAAYPALHAHMKPFEPALRQRQDRGRFWWELRPCNYYDELDRPKIVVQQILYHSVFSLDAESYWVNQTVYFLPTDDLYLLAMLNSRVLWWYIYRTWPHKKDEALSVQKPALLSLPIPDAPAELRAQIEGLVRKVKDLADASDQTEPEALALEQQIQAAVEMAYGLSRADVAIIERTLPPRDPLVVAESRLHKAKR